VNFVKTRSAPPKTGKIAEETGIKTVKTREHAWRLLTEYTTSESLRKHAMSVEVCMRAYARKFGEDEELWGMTGLLHDFDYEKHPSPEEHPWVGNKILREHGYPEELMHAIMGHAEYTHTPRVSRIDRALFACDELSGFITATALVKPSKSVREVDVKSIRKKMKDKAFARGVNREDIIQGAAELEIDLDEHIAFCIDAMTQAAESLGLAGASPISA
jgi:putative nucleotidyltransferase with HDIG domain